MRNTKFDLQAALKGAPVVRKVDGRKATQIAHFPAAGDVSRVVVLFENQTAVDTYREDGQYLAYPSGYDLEMAPKVFRRWLNLYNTEERPDAPVIVYRTKKDADQCASADRIECREITWEDSERS